MKNINFINILLSISFLTLINLSIGQNNGQQPTFEEIQEIELSVKQTSKDIKNSAKSLNELGKTIEKIKTNNEATDKSFLDVKLYDDDFIKLSFRFLIIL